MIDDQILASEGNTYSNNELVVIGYTKGFTLWRYKTDHTYRRVIHARYFDGSPIREGDMIICTVEVDVAPQSGILAIVKGMYGLIAVEAGFRKRDDGK